MSDTNNPYQSVNVNIEDKTPVPAGDAILTASMLSHLSRAQPWLRFLGVMGYIGVGFIALAGVIMMFASPLLSRFGDTGLSGGMAVGMGALYLVLAVTAFFPAKFTFKFGNKIRAYRQGGRPEDLEEAFSNNRSLWKFSGILMIIYLAVIPVVLIVSIIIGISAAL